MISRNFCINQFDKFISKTARFQINLTLPFRHRKVEIGLILTSFILIFECSNSMKLNPKKNLISNNKLINDFNLALTNFLTDYKSKNPTFNLSLVDKQLDETLRIKRELDLNDELNLAFRNKKKLSNSERSKKLDENDYSLEQNELQEQIELKECLNCRPSDELRKYKLEQFKRELLQKLNLDEMSKVDLSPEQRQIISKNYFESQDQFSDPNYQNDENPDDYLNHSNDDDEDEDGIKQMMIFGKKAPSYLKLDDKTLYFNFSEFSPSNQILNSELVFKIALTPEFDSLVNPVHVTVYKYQRTADGKDVPYLVAQKKTEMKGTSAWITINISELVNFWISNPSKNYGLFIHCYSGGKKFDPLYETDPGNNIFVKTRNKPILKNRSKRNLANDCNELNKSDLCCRKPFKVNLTAIVESIIEPQIYNIYQCEGMCNYGIVNSNYHSSIMIKKGLSSTVCCTGREYSKLAILYATKKNNDITIIFKIIDNMVVERCGCT